MGISHYDSSLFVVISHSLAAASFDIPSRWNQLSIHTPHIQRVPNMTSMVIPLSFALRLGHKVAGCVCLDSPCRDL